MDWKNRSAYVFIKTKEGKAYTVWQRFHNWDNIIGTWIVSGGYDVIAWFDAHDWDVVHRHIADIKNWDEVENTSSHMVYNGYKNDYWWWDKPVGTWVLIKENKLNETHDKIRQWNWMTSGASIPGDWDYLAWIGGENWEEIWGHLLELKAENWETSTQVPIKSWWNQSWQEKWWCQD